MDPNHPKVSQELSDRKAPNKGAAGRKPVTPVSSFGVWTEWVLRSVMWRCGTVPVSEANTSKAWASSGAVFPGLKAHSSFSYMA